MLRSISGRKFHEWQAFYELEPDAAERNDWGLAHIVQALVRSGKPLRDFLLPFGDSVPFRPTPQSVQYQEMLIDAWVFGNNAALKK